MPSIGSLSPGRTLCMGSPHLALLPPGCIAVCSIVGPEKKSPGVVAAPRGFDILEPPEGGVQAFQFRCCNHLEARIPHFSTRVNTSECRKLSTFLTRPVCQLFGLQTARRSGEAGWRPTRPRGGPGPPRNGARRAGAPTPARGPARGGTGRRSRPQRRPQPERPEGRGEGRGARARANSERKARRPPDPSPGGPGAAPPGAEAETRNAAARAAAAARSPPRGSRSREEAQGARQGPQGRPRRQRPRGQPTPRRGEREGGGDGREQTRPREGDARAEAKMGGGRRSGADRARRAATPRPRAHTA